MYKKTFEKSSVLATLSQQRDPLVDITNWLIFYGILKKVISDNAWDLKLRDLQDFLKNSSHYPDSNLHTYFTFWSARILEGKRFGVAIMTHMKQSACSLDFLPVWCFITEDEKWCSDKPYIF